MIFTLLFLFISLCQALSLKETSWSHPTSLSSTEGYSALHFNYEGDSNTISSTFALQSNLLFYAKGILTPSSSPSWSLKWSPNYFEFFSFSTGLLEANKSLWQSPFFVIGKQWTHESFQYSLHFGSLRAEQKTKSYFTALWQSSSLMISPTLFFQKQKFGFATEVFWQTENNPLGGGLSYDSEKGFGARAKLQLQNEANTYLESHWQPDWNYSTTPKKSNVYLRHHLQFISNHGAWVNDWNHSLQKNPWKDSWKSSYLKTQIPIQKHSHIFTFHKPTLYGGLFQHAGLALAATIQFSLFQWKNTRINTLAYTDSSKWKAKPYFETLFPIHPVLSNWTQWQFYGAINQFIDEKMSWGLVTEYQNKISLQQEILWRESKIYASIKFKFKLGFQFKSSKASFGLTPLPSHFSSWDSEIIGGQDPHRVHLDSSFKAITPMLKVNRNSMNTIDFDHDGIENQNDQCPKKAEDLDGYQDLDGCPDLDNDNDGVSDALDQCPLLSEDFDSFQDLDGCPDLDNDNDGFIDTEDLCPLQAEDHDNYLDHDGCPDLDNDNDSIPDDRDVCLNKAEDFDGVEDKDGCPEFLDQDKVPQNIDLCPGQNEDYDNFEDFDGCPDLDNDWDGIFDKNDLCPNLPETINGFQDLDGCPDN